MKLEIRHTLTNNLEIGFADSGTSAIAVILPERFQTAGGYAETRPDIETARLFAASPELLDALRELCADTYLADPINADRMSKARAAIAKAEGREA